MSFICSKSILDYISCISLREWDANNRMCNRSSTLLLVKANPQLRTFHNNEGTNSLLLNRSTNTLLSRSIKAIPNSTIMPRLRRLVRRLHPSWLYLEAVKKRERYNKENVLSLKLTSTMIF